MDDERELDGMKLEATPIWDEVAEFLGRLPEPAQSEPLPLPTLVLDEANVDV